MTISAPFNSMLIARFPSVSPGYEARLSTPASGVTPLKAKPSSLSVRPAPVKFLTEQTMRCAPILIPSAKSEGRRTQDERQAPPIRAMDFGRQPKLLNEGNARLASRLELSE